ncbi:MAG: F0F1 ATP synthase subunit delta [Gammaproteobacteria bacterium]|nr:F0F1 ATP synthase subunit delta [Gammaproteobacteria bacterium]
MSMYYHHVRGFFRKVEKTEESLAHWDKFFTQIARILSVRDVERVLRYPLASRQQKKNLFIVSFQNTELLPLQIQFIDLLVDRLVWIDFDAFQKAWQRLVEDYYKVGLVTVRSMHPLQAETEENILKYYKKMYPDRNFTIKFEQDIFPGFIAQFRDAVLEMNPSVMIEHLILTLKKGH